MFGINSSPLTAQKSGYLAPRADYIATEIIIPLVRTMNSDPSMSPTSAVNHCLGLRPKERHGGLRRAWDEFMFYVHIDQMTKELPDCIQSLLQQRAIRGERARAESSSTSERGDEHKTVGAASIGNKRRSPDDCSASNSDRR